MFTKNSLFNFKDPLFGTVDTLNIYAPPQKEEEEFVDVMDQTLQFAPIQSPYNFVPQVSHTKSDNKLMKFNHGTTTLGFKFNGGVIIAVDSRASMGQFIASETVRKVIEINDFLLGTMAGGAADCQFWENYLNMQCRLYQLQNHERVSVAAASKILNNILYNYRRQGLSMGVMIAGTDKTGQRLFYLDNDGTRMEGDCFAVGSGGTYAYGVVDTKRRMDMSIKEAVELGKQAIYHATHRDAGSGGYCRVYHIHADGWTKVHDGLDVNELHWNEYSKPQQGFEVEDVSLTEEFKKLSIS